MRFSSIAIVVGLLIRSVCSYSQQDKQPPFSERTKFFTRRQTFVAVASSFLTLDALSMPVVAAQEKELRQGIEVTAFNGLIFNYKGGDFNGLSAKDLQEPSVTYAEFNEKLKAGEVEFVEFIAPDGDVAYATFKAKEGQAKNPPIRIGEGYPIEQHDGYSSPLFCVRAVKNAGVPYKFTVPALANFNKKL